MASKINWRKWNNILHRDIGYLCFGLTIIYAISGIAVNHARDWNPNYSVEILQGAVKPLTVRDRPLSSEEVASIKRQVNASEPFRTHFQPSPKTLRLFYEGNTVTIDLTSGNYSQERVRRRLILYEMNYLHLNVPKSWWTWLADIYAAALTLLAITGLFVLRGKKGITGRGAWLTSVGVIIPLFFLWLYL